MSSSIDDITCPNCGGSARRETDHKTGEVVIYCKSCGYENTIIEGESTKKYKLVNNQDANNEIELESTDEEDAVTEAFEVLGWSLVAYRDKN